MSIVAQKILLLEPDRAYAERLLETLNRIGSFSVVVVPTLKEACLHLVQTPHDLAFVPIHDGAKIIRSLRAIQPDLRLILLAPAPDAEIPVTYSGRIQGVLIKSSVEIELAAILREALEQPFFVRGAGDIKTPTDNRLVDTAVLVTVLGQADLSYFVQTAVLAHDQQLLAYWGEFNGREAATIALHVGKEWPHKEPIDRLQLLHLPARAGDLLLYTHVVQPHYLLTLAALPEAPIAELRRQASQLAISLTEALHGRALFAAPVWKLAAQGKSVHGRVSHAIVWQPQDPLADALIVLLRQALLRLASLNGCVLTHTHIQPDLVHVVVTCPPEQDINWLVTLLKDGSAQILGQRYDLQSLWQPGFYAVESAQPLSDEELNLFLLGQQPPTS